MYGGSRLLCLVPRLRQWWLGELERPYELHKARVLKEQHAQFVHVFTPALAALDSVGAPLHRCVAPRMRPLPSLELVGLPPSPPSENEGTQSAKQPGKGWVGEEEMQATLRFVLDDLAPELLTELTAGLPFDEGHFGKDESESDEEASTWDMLNSTDDSDEDGEEEGDYGSDYGSD
jgi:hypothetical protein